MPYYRSGRALGRRTFLRGAAGVGAAGALAFTGVACGDDDDAPSGGSSPAGSPTAKFNNAATSVTTLQGTPGGKVVQSLTSDPQQKTTPVWETLYANRLLKYKTGSDISPNQYDLVADLAASWETPAPDRVIFKLNPAAKFHDKAPVNGRAVSSDDVKTTFKYLNTDKTTYLFRYLVDFVDQVNTPDPQTVELRLKYPTPLILNSVAYYNAAIAPAEVFAADGDLKKNTIGSGPYLFDKAEKGIAYNFKRNPNYFVKERPYLDEVEFDIVPDSTAAFETFRAGKLDALDIAFEQLENAQKTFDKNSVTIQTQPGVGWNAFWFNVEKPPFNDLRVRQAFNLAIDRVVLNNLVSQNQAAIRTGPVSRGWSQWSRSDADILADSKRDVAKAKQLLSAAGLEKGFDVEFSSHNQIASSFKRTAEVVQQQVKDAGINFTFNLQERAQFDKRLQTQDFQLSNWGIRAYPDPDDYLYAFFYPGGSKNWGHSNDTALNDLILKQRSAADATQRRAVLQEIDRRWNNDWAFANFSIEFPYVHVYQSRLGNYSGRNPSDWANLEGAFIKKA